MFRGCDREDGDISRSGATYFCPWRQKWAVGDNHRKAINARTLGIPVVAVGVPTVIAASLLGEGGGEDEPLFLTPRDIDEKVRELGRLIGYGISLGLQEGLSVEDVTGLLG